MTAAPEPDGERKAERRQTIIMKWACRIMAVLFYGTWAFMAFYGEGDTTMVSTFGVVFHVLSIVFKKLERLS
jgi:hypothetical protein